MASDWLSVWVCFARVSLDGERSIDCYCSSVVSLEVSFDLTLASFLISQSDWYNTIQNSKEKEEEQQTKSARYYFYANPTHRNQYLHHTIQFFVLVAMFNQGYCLVQCNFK